MYVFSLGARGVRLAPIGLDTRFLRVRRTMQMLDNAGFVRDRVYKTDATTLLLG